MKTTKKVRPIASLQKFNQNETVNTLTIKGNTSLADLSIDRLGNVDLTLYSDPTKLSSITSISPLLTATTTGSSATLSISTSELELLIHQIVEQQLKNIPALAQGGTVGRTANETVSETPTEKVNEPVNETVSGEEGVAMKEADGVANERTEEKDKGGDTTVENGVETVVENKGDKGGYKEVEKVVDSSSEKQVENSGETVVEPVKDSEGDKVVESGSENNEASVSEKSVESEINPVPVNEAGTNE